MSQYLNVLNESEQKLLVDAPVLITLLVGGADDNLDKKEREWSSKLTNYRTLDDTSILQEYYEQVNVDFDKKLNEFVEIYPDKAAQRNPMIAEQLSSLNDIIVKLDAEFAYEVYKSLKSYAEQIAKSSGGILGFFNQNAEEKRWTELPMLNEVAPPPAPEEEA